MAQLSILANPFALILSQRLMMTLLVGFTSSDSLLRPMLVPLMVVWNVYMLPHYSETTQCKIWVVFWAGEAIFAIMHYIEKILLRRWSYDAASFTKFNSIVANVDSSKDQDSLKIRQKTKAPTENSDGEGSLWNRLHFGLYIAFSDRYIGSPHQVAHTPPYSASNPSYIPAHTSFVLRKIFIVATCYLMLDILSQRSDSSLNAIIYADTEIPFVSRLWHGHMSILEITIRTVTSIVFWFVGFLVVQVCYSALSLLAVSAGVSRPEVERPVFGSVAEAYTLRGFWGRAWHQFLRSRLTSIADWVTYDLLALPRSSGKSSKGEGRNGKAKALIMKLGSRYTHVLVCFLVSGIAHQFHDVALGMRWGESGAVVFFVLMAVGIMVEDAVQCVWYDVLLSVRDRRNTQQGPEVRGALWARIIGFLWVVFWLSVSTPWYAYPTMSRNEGGLKDQIVPFSVVGWIRDSL